MKFNLGEWRMKPGVSSFNCEQIRDIRICDEGKRVHLYAVKYREDTRSMDGPALEIDITSPIEDIIRFEVCHFKGVRTKFPAFDLRDNRITLSVARNDNEIRVCSGNTSVVITCRPCTIRFFYKDRLLTSVGDRFGSPMLSYITAPEGSFLRGQLDIGVGEKVYGFGEHFNALIKNGQSIDIWNEDGGTSSEIGYKCIPFYMTNRGYGVLINDPGPVSFEVCTEAATRVQFSVPGQKLDFMVIGADSMKRVLKKYTMLSGSPALPPPWTFGLWLSSSFTTSYDEK
ncbi:MAG: alpha-xylosidase, partial [Clostridia bacterium]|nr:alpha-xylosidase [Clostridia bacterium]